MLGHKHTLFALSLITGMLLISSNSFAQVERLPGVVDRPSPGIEVEKKIKEQEPSKPLEEAPWLQDVEDPDEVVAEIKSIVFEGNTVLSNEELQEVVKPYINRIITKGDLAKLKYDISVAFYEKGYILVKPVTSPQDVSNGILKVTIHEALVGQINVNDPEGLLNKTVENAMTARSESGEVFFERTVESMVSDLNDLKNVNATVNLSPGKQFKTTDLNLLLTKVDEDIQWISVDNYGSELTGQNVATAHLEKSNFLHFGETLYSDWRRSDGDLISGLVGVDTPIALRNIHFDVNYLHSENEIGDRLAPLDANGKSDVYSVSLYSDLLNTRKDKFTLRTGFESRDHESQLADILDTRDNIKQGFVTASHLHRGIDYVFYGEAKISRGLNIIDANKKGDVLATRQIGEPEAWKLNPLFIISWRPDWEILEQNGTLKFQASGQVASNTLLSSDLFVLGGYGNVRGFEPAQATGESGYQYSLEYSHDLPSHEDWAVSAGPFFDGGTVYNRVEGQVLDNNLYSTGINVEAVSSELTQVGETKIVFDAAHIIGDYNGTNLNDGTVYLRVKQSFGGL